MHLAKEDIPAAYYNWIERKLQLSKVIKSLGEEMKDKLKSQMEVGCYFLLLALFFSNPITVLIDFASLITSG